MADAVAAKIGSWKFLIYQTLAVIAWVTLNTIGLVRHWDIFPFVLLNLLFSVQAAYTGPVLMLSQNRQSAIDRAHAENSYAQIDEIAAKLTQLLKQ